MGAWQIDKHTALYGKIVVLVAFRSRFFNFFDIMDSFKDYIN